MATDVGVFGSEATLPGVTDPAVTSVRLFPLAIDEDVFATQAEAPEVATAEGSRQRNRHTGSVRSDRDRRDTVGIRIRT